MGQTSEVVRLVADVLGPDLVGLYRYGSSVTGGLKPASDVDLLVVSRTTLDEPRRRALLAGLMPISGVTVDARPVELTVVVQSEVRPWRWPPIGDFQYGEWLRAEYEAGMVPRSAPMPELALAIAITLAGDQTLAGPPPAQVLDSVPPSDLMAASLAGIPELLADLPGDTRNVMLTLARVWTTLATGAIRSKDEAADWVLPQLPAHLRPSLEHAKRLYLTTTYADETWSDDLRAQVRPYVDEVLDQLHRLSPPA